LAILNNIQNEKDSDFFSKDFLNIAYFFIDFNNY